MQVVDDVRVASFTELDPATLYALLRLRADVFVVEQRCPYPDLDGRDLEESARHLWFAPAGVPVGYLRLLTEPEGTARISRVVVAPAARGSGVAGRLLRVALAQAPRRDCVLAAQAHLVELYARYGFAVTGPRYLEDDIWHVPMRRPG